MESGWTVVLLDKKGHMVKYKIAKKIKYIGLKTSLIR